MTLQNHGWSIRRKMVYISRCGRLLRSNNRRPNAAINEISAKVTIKVSQDHRPMVKRLMAKRKSLGSHFNRLRSIEARIASICNAKGVTPDILENHLDSFSVEDEDTLLELLQEKLALQELVFKMQGGCLDNVVFLASHR